MDPTIAAWVSRRAFAHVLDRLGLPGDGLQAQILGRGGGRVANCAEPIRVTIDGQEYGQVKVTNSAGVSSTVMGLAPSSGYTGYRRAQIVSQRLNDLLGSKVRHDFITSGIINDNWVVHHQDPWAKPTIQTLIVTASNEDAAHHGHTRWHLTLVWANSIRSAIDPFKVLPGGKRVLVDIQQGIAPVTGSVETTATYYSEKETPYAVTDSGECWHPYDVTCAIWALREWDTCHQNKSALIPHGTYLRVTNLKNDKQIVVRVNDRGPNLSRACGTPKKLIDLSHGAAHAIGFEFKTGSNPVKLERLS